MTKEHGQRKCRNGSDKGALWAETELQSWSQNGNREFWIVRSGQKDLPSPVIQSPRRKRRLSQIRKAEVERTAQRQRLIETDGGEDALLSSNWMRRTGWTEMFLGANRSFLVMLGTSPKQSGDTFDVGDAKSTRIAFSDTDERRLVAVGHAIDRFFDRCEDTLHHTGHSLRCCLHSYYPARSSKSPLELPSRVSTRARYRSLWKRMIFFCIRVYQLEERIRRTILCLPSPDNTRLATQRLWSEFTDTAEFSPNVPSDVLLQQTSSVAPTTSSDRLRRKSKYTATAQRAGVGFASSVDSPASNVIGTIDEGDYADESGEYDETDEKYVQMSGSESADDHEDSNGSVSRSCEGSDTSMIDLFDETTSDDRLLDAIAQFCVFLCSQPYRDGKLASTVMVYFAGVLGISRDGTTFERPSNYTPKLSALVHMARLCVLEATLPRFPYPRLGWHARPGFSQQKTLNRVREALLCQGSEAPVGELLSLRAYGRTVSRTDGPAFRVDWSRDGQNIRWDGGELSMADLRGIGHKAVALVNRFIAAKLRGTGRKAVVLVDRFMANIFGTLRPDLDMGTLRDKISEHKNGYSFVHDKTNGLDSIYLELFERVCANPVHSLMSRNGWNERAVRRFLKKEKKLFEYIMVMMYLRGGQAP
jgi:hypothetical protein